MHSDFIFLAKFAIKKVIDTKKFICPLNRRQNFFFNFFIQEIFVMGSLALHMARIDPNL